MIEVVDEELGEIRHISYRDMFDYLEGYKDQPLEGYKDQPWMGALIEGIDKALRVIFSLLPKEDEEDV